VDIDRVSALLVDLYRSPTRSFTIDDVRTYLDRLDFRVSRRQENPARLRIGLPESGEKQFWLYVRPHDHADWVGQLLNWIEEEVATGGLGASRVREEREGESYVLVEPYGWRLADESRHRELLSAAGPDGWYGPMSELP
jgi:hypothetical protein